jgi:2-iminobutanoate/2-iminopropanoate deaminase
MMENGIEAIVCGDAPVAIGPYSQAVMAGGIVFVSGQIPIDPETGEMTPGGIKEQTARVIRNAQSILRAAGTGLERVVRVDVFLCDLGDFEAMNEVYGAMFVSPVKPARCVIQAAGIPRGARIEIACVAMCE